MNTPNSNNFSRSRLLKSLAILWCISALHFGTVTSQAVTTNVYITTNTIPLLLGYMNWYTNLTDWTNNVRIDGSAWAWADLPAIFNYQNGAVTLSPNTSVYNASDPYWVKPDGSGAKVMEANFYAEDDTLVGKNIIFKGNCWTNSLANGYFTRAFIKMFTNGNSYSSFLYNSVNVTSGAPFQVALVGNTNFGHVQWGFLTVGKDANPATVASLGRVVLASNAPPTNVVIVVPPQNAYAIVHSNAVLSVVAFGAGLNYQWQKYGVRLTNSAVVAGVAGDTLTLSNVTSAAEGTYTVVITNSTSSNSASAYLTVVDPTNLTLDAAAPWIGTVNLYTNIGNTQGTYVQTLSPFGLNELQARFNNGAVTLAPNTNTYNPADPYWVQPNGQSAFFLEAFCLQQWDALGGQTLTFNGYCVSNSLDPSYTCSAFIRDSVPNYSLHTDATVPLVAGQPFSVSLGTAAGDHIQWGFVMLGTNAPQAAAAALGNVVVYSAATLPNVANPPQITASISGGLIHLNFASQTGFNYTVQYKTNITAATWQTLSTTPGTGSPLDVTDPSGVGQRYYRVSAQ